MSSWWGPTWISVRCRGKKEWTSSPVGSAQTQRRAQMKSPTSATPTHPCQVKTIPSDLQIDRQAARMPAIMHHLSGAQQGSQLFSLPFVIWSCQKYQHLSTRSVSGFSPCPLAPGWHLSHLPPPAQRGALASTAPPPVDDRGQAFPGACLSVLSPSQWGGSDLEEACPGCV